MNDDHAAFIGSIPQYYDRVLVPLIFVPSADQLVARVKKSGASRVLELACGTGSVTTRLAKALGSSARITATDLNEAMIDVGRSKQPRGASITWRQADATNLPFESRSFDAIVCQFGWMFFTERAQAMREARRVLEAGGGLFYNVWDRMESCPVYLEVNRAIHAFFPTDPPLFYETPFSMFDEREHRRLMGDAGFHEISIDVYSHEGAAMLANDMADGIVRGSPVVAEIEARKADVRNVIAFIARRLEERFGAGPFTSPMKAVFCAGTVPT